MFKEIAAAIKEHLFESLDEMKINIAKDLDVSEDQIKFVEHSNRTDICVTKDGKEISVIVRGAK